MEWDGGRAEESPTKGRPGEITSEARNGGDQAQRAERLQKAPGEGKFLSEAGGSFAPGQPCAKALDFEIPNQWQDSEAASFLAKHLPFLPPSLSLGEGGGRVQVRHSTRTRNPSCGTSPFVGS